MGQVAQLKSTSILQPVKHWVMGERPVFTPEKTGANSAWACEFTHNSPCMKTHPGKYNSQQLRVPLSWADAQHLAPRASTLLCWEDPLRAASHVEAARKGAITDSCERGNPAEGRHWECQPIFNSHRVALLSKAASTDKSKISLIL